MKVEIDVDYCIEQYEKGRTIQEIADELGCSWNTVRRRMAAQGTDIQKRGTRQKYCPYIFLAFAEMGMTTYEIERLTGVNHSNVSTHLRKLGYRRGKGNGPKRAEQDAAKREEGHRRFMERFAEKYGNRFEYLGGYVSTHSNAKPLLKCKTCGHEFNRYIDWDCEIRCPECYKREMEANREAKANEIRRYLVYFKRCEECGEAFCTDHPDAKFCSKQCRRRVKDRRSRAKRREQGRRRNSDTSHRKRARKYGVPYDSSITLEKVIERDGNICHICGGECNKDDKAYGLIGPTYPSIDCVIAMANGGGFTWDNVALAHIICNSKKRDLMVS